MGEVRNRERNEETLDWKRSSWNENELCEFTKR